MLLPHSSAMGVCMCVLSPSPRHKMAAGCTSVASPLHTRIASARMAKLSSTHKNSRMPHTLRQTNCHGGLLAMPYGCGLFNSRVSTGHGHTPCLNCANKHSSLQINLMSYKGLAEATKVLEIWLKGDFVLICIMFVHKHSLSKNMVYS